MAQVQVMFRREEKEWCENTGDHGLQRIEKCLHIGFLPVFL